MIIANIGIDRCGLSFEYIYKVLFIFMLFQIKLDLVGIYRNISNGDRHTHFDQKF